MLKTLWRRIMPAAIRWCGPCMALGIGLFLTGTVAVAQQPGPQTAQPDWLTVLFGVISLLAGMVVALIGAYVRGIVKSQDAQSASLRHILELHMQLQRQVDTQYHNKQESADNFNKLDRKLDALHVRLDTIGLRPSHQVAAPPRG